MQTPKSLKLTTQRVSVHLPLYHQQFSNPNSKGLIQDGNSDFFVFSTGRRNLVSLHTIFTLRPRHDFFQILFQTARTLIELPYRPTDDLQLDFKLAPGTLNDNFVFAIVAKDELLSIKDSRWDLVRFEVRVYKVVILNLSWPLVRLLRKRRIILPFPRLFR